jgi:hypothetical protein
MRNHALLIRSSVALALVVGISGQAMAQSAAPATPAATPLATTPASTAPGAAAPTTPATPAAPEAAPPAAAPPAAAADASAAPAAPAAATPPAEAPPASYFRIDHDYAFGLQLWAGATYALGEGIGLATDIYIAEFAPGGYTNKATPPVGTPGFIWYGEFDIGPAFTFGPLSLTPMVGIGFDWAAKHVNAINGPQLYTIINTDKIYVESWVWTFLYSPFKQQDFDNYFHTRDWILYKLSGTVALGPQIELWTNLQDKVSGHKGVTSLPIGGHIDLTYGTGNTLGLFLGYDANKYGRNAAHDGNGAVGRLTFVHNF